MQIFYTGLLKLAIFKKSKPNFWEYKNNEPKVFFN